MIRLLRLQLVFSLWDRVQPRSTRATTEEAAQYAAATAKYLFDRVRIFFSLSQTLLSPKYRLTAVVCAQ